MRVATVIVVAALLVPAVASAQAWKDYINKDLHFSINFPDDPKVEKTIYKAPSGASVPATQFSGAKEDGSTFVLTVADFSAAPWEENGTIAHAAANIRKLGQVKYDDYAQLNGIPGHQLGLQTKDGGRIQAIVHIYNHLLYIAVGSAPKDTPPPSSFPQTLTINDDQGRPINLDRGVPREQQAGYPQRAAAAAAIAAAGGAAPAP